MPSRTQSSLSIVEANCGCCCSSQRPFVNSWIENGTPGAGVGMSGVRSDTASGELANQRSFAASAGKKRARGSRRSSHRSSSRRSWTANSMRPSTMSCVATRTSISFIARQAHYQRRNSPANGLLRHQQGRNGHAAARRSPHTPPAWRSWMANSVRPSSRRPCGHADLDFADPSHGRPPQFPTLQAGGSPPRELRLVRSKSPSQPVHPIRLASQENEPHILDKQLGLSSAAGIVGA